LADETSLESTLRDLHCRMTRLQAHPAVGAPALAVPEWDRLLWRIGRDQVATRRPALSQDLAPARRPARDVYLATQVYEIGGHTALIGDMVRARPAADASIIVSNLLEQNPPTVPDVIVSRLGVPSARVRVLPGPSLADRLGQLLDVLEAVQPDTLFLFHHPQDPLACLVSQPELARRRLLLHHADATPSFGLSLPGVTLVDLSPSALANTRLLGRGSVLLPLTAPDPGPRPAGFLARGRLVTASSGSAHKFAGPDAPGYAETVALVLEATRGWHLHIGPLPDETLAGVAAAIAARHVDPDRFIYVRSTPSVATALMEQGCDIYLASFPIDGARTKVEVLASGTPYVRHSRYLPIEGDPSIDAEGFFVWRSCDDLLSILDHLSTPDELRVHGTLARRRYEQNHHPEVFARRLDLIVQGVVPPDPVDGQALLTAMMRTVRAMASTRLDEATLADRVDGLESRMETAVPALGVLEHEVERLRVALDEAEARADAARLAGSEVERPFAQRLWNRLRRS